MESHHLRSNIVANRTLATSESIAVKPSSFDMTLHVATSLWTERLLDASLVMRAIISTVSGSQSNARSNVQAICFSTSKLLMLQLGTRKRLSTQPISVYSTQGVRVHQRKG
jgi:hypothetical protein